MDFRNGTGLVCEIEAFSFPLNKMKLWIMRERRYVWVIFLNQMVWDGTRTESGMESGLSLGWNQDWVWVGIRTESGLESEMSLGWNQDRVWDGTRTESGMESGLSLVGRLGGWIGAYRVGLLDDSDFQIARFALEVRLSFRDKPVLLAVPHTGLNFNL